MIFTRTHIYHFPLPKEEIKRRLVGKHVKIHNLDFEILEKDFKLSIIPHAEQVEEIKTLPITSIVFADEGGKTKLTVKSKMRNLDSGGPILIIAFSSFLILASLLLLAMRYDTLVAFALLGLGLVMLILFAVRLQTGYFDYVHKVNEYIKTRSTAAN